MGRLTKRVVILGAGAGGLAAAINLAGLGFTVTVLEKERLPGGRMKGVALGTDGEYALDTGPTILQLPEVLARIFERSGKVLADYVTLTRLVPSTRLHFWDGSQLDTFGDAKRMEAAVEALKPGLGAAFARWAAMSRDKYTVAYEKFICTPAESLSYYAPWRLLPSIPFKPWQSLYRHFDGFFHDDRMSYALAYPSKYLGLHPTTCASVFSVIPFLELAFGVWHVQGGFRALARGMQRCAEDLGAAFRLGTPAERVWIEEGRVRGVELVGGERVAADAVVVNADLPYAATRLIDERWRAGTGLSDERLNRAKYSCSTFMLYLGLDRVYSELPHHLIYLSEAVRRTDPEALEDLRIDLEDPPFYVCNPCVTDPSGAPPGHSTLYVLVPTPNTSRPVDWAAAEKALAQRVPGWLAKVGLKDVARHIQAQRSCTAETWRDAFNVHRGAVFGLSHTWRQLGPLRPKVKSREVDGLYFVGGGTHPGSGLLTIMESANIAADYLARASGRTSGLPGWPYVPQVGAPPRFLVPSGAVG